MEKNKILRGLIILVSVVVIIESIIIIGKLGRGEPVVILQKEVPTVAEVKKEAVLTLSTTTENWSKGRMGKVMADLNVTRDMGVDAIDLFIKYDPTKVDVSELSFVGGEKATLSKISKDKGLVIANYLVTDKGGMRLMVGENKKLLTFNATPKVSGEVQFEVATGKPSDGSVTMIIENEKSSEVGFTSLPLTVNVK